MNYLEIDLIFFNNSKLKLPSLENIYDDNKDLTKCISTFVDMMLTKLSL